MKIVVCIKQVPARDSLLRVDPSAAWIQEDDLTYEINEPDAYALEEGLQLKEKHGGEVVVLVRGPAGAAQTIREALAKGADRAIHIEEEKLGGFDPLALARLMAAALQTEKPDLVLTGLQSDDLGYGQTGVILAELLGLPHATIIMHVEKQDSGIRVKRELEDGWFQHVEMPLPALLTIQSGINKLRYATLMGIKKAKTKEVKRLTAAELGIVPRASIRIERMYLPEKSKHTADAGRLAERSRGETGGETEVRGAGPMSILAILEQRAGVWHRMSWETLAAAQQIGRGAGAAGECGGDRHGCFGARGRAGRQATRARVRGRARTAEELHAGWIHSGAGATDRGGQTAAGLVPAHVPGARFCAEARHVARTRDGERCGGASRRRRASWCWCASFFRAR